MNAPPSRDRFNTRKFAEENELGSPVLSSSTARGKLLQEGVDMINFYLIIKKCQASAYRLAYLSIYLYYKLFAFYHLGIL